jgi:preprotein translocase subunit SecB
MSDTDEKQEEQQAKSAQFALQKIYIKDLSFESPRAIESFTQKNENPEINLQLNTEIQKLENDQFEVTLEITVTAREKDSEKVFYLIELKQTGLFRLVNFPEQELVAMLNTYCPGVLFPYAREAVSSIVERGGFPQLLLTPINFDALYQQHLAKMKQADSEDSSTTH